MKEFEITYIIKGYSVDKCSVHMGQTSNSKPGPKPEAYPYLLEHMHDGCCAPWPFMNIQGRSALNLDYKIRVAAQVVCELVNGAKPTPKHHALHKCGKGHLGCFNADCTYWGTHQQNMDDMVLHGTVAKGERNGGGGKLVEDDIRNIRQLRETMSVLELGRMFKVDSTMISRICRRVAWSHVQ